MSDILLNEQAELENEKLRLESENVNLMQEFQLKDKYSLKNKEAIHRLKKEKKREIGVINSYLNVINNLNRGTYYHKENYDISDIKINQNQSKLNENKKEKEKVSYEFKCNYCTNKIFQTEFELTKHLEEVHGVKKSSLNNNIQEQSQPQEQIQILKPEVTIKVPDNLYQVNQNKKNKCLFKLKEWTTTFDISFNDNETLIYDTSYTNFK